MLQHNTQSDMRVRGKGTSGPQVRKVQKEQVEGRLERF